eukprot:2881048-Ditylum_brightwellii.AAC.1
MAECPQQYSKELETALHVVECPKATPLWIKLQSILFEWSAKERAKPGLCAVIKTSIYQWREGEEHVPRDTWTDDIRKAFDAQTHIGWEATLKGFLFTKWQNIQARHYACLKEEGQILWQGHYYFHNYFFTCCYLVPPQHGRLALML